LTPLLLLGWLAAATIEPPSVVLITLDTTRSDHVGRIEGGSPLTPNLDALAKSGVRFRNALTASPLTLPAHCSILTGLEPPAHGVRDNGVTALPAGIPTLAEAFAGRGYRTAAFVASRVLDRRFGLARGFDVYSDRFENGAEVVVLMGEGDVHGPEAFQYSRNGGVYLVEQNAV